MSTHPYADEFPAPPSPDLGKPEVLSSRSRHVAVLIYPWANDDHDTVIAQLNPLIDTLRALVDEMGRGR